MVYFQQQQHQKKNKQIVIVVIHRIQYGRIIVLCRTVTLLRSTIRGETIDVLVVQRTT